MISVIIPCYNFGHLIGETIQSVIDQTYSDWEIIVVDDGSSDNTQEVVQKFSAADRRVQYHYQDNAGPSAARNLGLKLSKGEFVHFLDADDLLQKEKYTRHLKKFEENEDLDIVYGNVRYIGNDFVKTGAISKTFWGRDKEWVRDISGNGRDILHEALKGNFAHLSTTIYRRRIVEKAGDFDITKRAAEDYHFLLKCILADANILYHNDPGTFALIRWHLNNTSKSSVWILEGQKKVHEELIPVLEKIGNKNALESNLYAIKGIELINNKSWKTVFMSGGKFESVKKILSFLGLTKLVKKFFYHKYK